VLHTTVRHVRFDETVFPGFHLTEKKDGALTDEIAQEYLLDEDKELEDGQDIEPDTQSGDPTRYDKDPVYLEAEGRQLQEMFGNDTENEQVHASANVPTHRHSLRRNPQGEHMMMSVVKDTYSNDEPTLDQAMESDQRNEWAESIQKEITELEEQGTWTLTNRPKGKRILPCKLVLKIKKYADGEIDR
jgi:hypothetical protein